MEPVIVDLVDSDTDSEPAPAPVIVLNADIKEIVKKSILESWCNGGLDLAEDSWIQWQHGPHEYDKFLNNPRPFKDERAGWLYTHWSQDFNDHGYASKPLIFDPCKLFVLHK